MLRELLDIKIKYFGHTLEDCLELDLDDCWEMLNSKLLVSNTLTIHKDTVTERFFNFLKTLDIKTEIYDKHYVFKNITFAEGNLIRYCYYYKHILDLCLEFFGSYSIDNIYCALVLSPDYWNNANYNFGGLLNTFCFKFIQLSKFRKGFKHDLSERLFTKYTSEHYCLKPSIFSNIYIDLKAKNYDFALELMKTIETKCNFQEDLKFVQKKYNERIR